MTNDKSKAIMDVLEELGRLYPTMRFGQLVTMVATLAGDSEPKEVYDVEDDEFIRVAREHLSKRSQAVSG